MRSARPVAIAGLVALSLISAACGTRRNDADFVGAGSTLQQQGGQQQAGAAGGATGGDAVAGSAGGTSGGAASGPVAGGTGAAAGSSGGGGAASGSGGGTAGGSGATSGGGGAQGGASDVGVTATSINLGNIVTKSGGFGPDQFTPFYYGAAAFFDDLNARGGINGRRVNFNTCDDQGQGKYDIACARSFVDQQKVFAFVSNNCLVCDGLTYISDKGVPSVGGVAIDSRDYSLPHSWRYSGDPYPQNGKIGWKGNLYQGTHQYRYFKTKFGVQKAAVVYYDNSKPSKNQGLAIAAALRAEGIEVSEYGINVALPQYDSAVLEMKQKGITAVWDSIDISGNQNLCKSIDNNGLVLKAKVSTIAVWSQQVGQQFSYPCRTYIYSVEDPGTLTYDQTDNPEIAKFRAAMKRYFPSREGKLFQWSVDGWASAMWFTDAALSCGADLTRACLEKYLNNPKEYTAHGIWWPRSNNKVDFDREKTLHRCISVAHWEDKLKTFKNVAPYSSTCFTTGYITAPAE